MTDKEFEEACMRCDKVGKYRNLYLTYTKINDSLRSENYELKKKLDFFLTEELAGKVYRPKEELDMAIDVIKKLLEDIHIAENQFNFTSQSAIKADKFLKGMGI